MFCEKCKEKSAFVLISEDIVISDDGVEDVEAYAVCNCLHCDFKIKVKFDIVNVRRIEENGSTKK